MFRKNVRPNNVMIMKKLIISLVVLAAVAGTVLAVTAKRTKTFAQENLEALADGEITPQQLLEICEKKCSNSPGATCSPEDTGLPFPITCRDRKNWP